MSGLIRIAEELLPWVDAVVDQCQNEFGGKKYGSRKDVIDDAVKRLVKELGVKPKEAA